MSVACAPPDDAVSVRRYSVAALFCELDGQSFSTFEELVDAVLALMNAHLTEFPVGYGYRDALLLARERGWLSVSQEGRAVTVTCSAPGAPVPVALVA